ncbi:hypothetical protein BC739_009377 [Kutzneria viridogrisea]|uniref:Uncharacterized protein n=1 Tax=Kutzneria viridogrisea TaxID=47990 RepID=A0ABR6BYY9_9PSEU|nr:hypothetical protein [Kutzneria viridogrisea]
MSPLDVMVPIEPGRAPHSRPAWCRVTAAVIAEPVTPELDDLVRRADKIARRR